MRNEGQSGFSDRTSTFPFVQGNAIDGTVVRTIPDGKGWDLAVSYTERGGVLYRDMLRGRYEAQSLDLLPARAASLGAYDVNNDGWVDLSYALPGQVVVLINRPRQVRSKSHAQCLPPGGFSMLIWRTARWGT